MSQDLADSHAEDRMASNEPNVGLNAADGERQGSSKSPTQLSLIALGLGLSFEVLFYGHRLGASFPIWVALAGAGLVGGAAIEAVPLNWRNLWLAVPILFLAVMTALRLEPLTVFLDVVLTLALLALWVRTFRSGRLGDYGWLDFGIAVAWARLEALVRAWATLGIVQRRLIDERGARSGLISVVRGLILAIPILAVFVILLTAADLVFGEYVDAALHWLDLERLADWAGRGVGVLASAGFCLGGIITEIGAADRRSLISDRSPLVKPFLGFTEVAIVLFSVDVLFALFVVVQLAYFFGGEANVTAAGFTYSEYARRGFGELVAVGVLSLGLIMLLAAVARRDERRQHSIFNSLSVALVILVGVILTSALKRLLLYEQAYGFTRLRTYTHVGILWMAVAFVVFLVLLLRGRLRRFAPACAAVTFGFVATLNLLNVDAFIVERNGTRLSATGELDVAYLVRLTEDAIPEIVQLAIVGSPEARAELLPELACWESQRQAEKQDLRWPSAHLARTAATRALAGIEPLLSGIPVEQGDYGVWWVGPKAADRACLHQPWGTWVD